MKVMRSIINAWGGDHRPQVRERTVQTPLGASLIARCARGAAE